MEPSALTVTTDQLPAQLSDLPELDADAVKAHVTATVAPYKKVREVEFVDAIPKNPSGKILRRELKAQERAKS